MAAACAPAAARLSLDRFEQAMLYHPSREFSVLPRTFRMPSEEVSLAPEPAISLHGWFLPAVDGPLADRGLVLLYCHGNGGNVSNRVHKSNVFHKLGLSVLVFDYRGFGKSTGSPDEAGTYRDGEAAYKFLTGKKGFPPERIILYGESLGNGVSLELARKRRSAALIVDSAFTSIPDMALEVFPWLPVRPWIRNRYDNLAKIGGVGRPVLVMHSPEDQVIPFEMGKRLFAAAAEPKAFLEMQGGHDEGYIDSSPRYERAISDLLKGLPPRSACGPRPSSPPPGPPSPRSRGRSGPGS